MSPPVIENEEERLATLHSLLILDTPTETEFDELVELAAWTCHVPIAAISLIDTNRQWFKATVGLDLPETDREIAFCAHTIQRAETLIVPDTATDDRFRGNPFVVEEPNVRFYAGVPLVVDEHQVGTLCVLDTRPRAMFSDERRALEIIARQVQARLDAQRLAWRSVDRASGASAAAAIERWMTCQSPTVSRAAIHFEVDVASDEMFRSVAATIETVAPDDALIARLDENSLVALITPQTDDELQLLSVRARAALDALELGTEIAMGVADAPPEHSGSDLIEAAQQATALEKRLQTH